MIQEREMKKELEKYGLLTEEISDEDVNFHELEIPEDTSLEMERNYSAYLDSMQKSRQPDAIVCAEQGMPSNKQNIISKHTLTVRKKPLNLRGEYFYRQDCYFFIICLKIAFLWKGE